VYGPNQLPERHEHTFLTNLARQVTHPLALLLWLAAGLAWAARTPALSFAIIGVIIINAVVAMLQEHQAARAVAAGDIIVLSEGDQVCADARLINGTVEMDMSTLTGESAPVTFREDLITT